MSTESTPAAQAAEQAWKDYMALPLITAHEAFKRVVTAALLAARRAQAEADAQIALSESILADDEKPCCGEAPEGLLRTTIAAAIRTAAPKEI